MLKSERGWPWGAGLDDSQRRAVSLALAAKDYALIHGPPGTGAHLAGPSISATRWTSQFPEPLGSSLREGLFNPSS